MSEIQSDSPQPWPVLSLAERRVLGVLIEKQKTTPDIYPLSLNALVSGCNQKSNRDPIMRLEDHEIESTLENLQKLALATRVESGRVDKWRHLIYERLNVGKVEIAVLAELLLRGPQSEGDLRGRASRMEPIEDLEALRAVLRLLATRGLVVYLTPEGRRGTTVTHGFHDPAELERHKSQAPAVEQASATPISISPAPSEFNDQSTLAPLNSEMAELRAEVAQLHLALAEMHVQLKALQAQITGAV